jgi:hypothetical protein
MRSGRKTEKLLAEEGRMKANQELRKSERHNCKSIIMLEYGTSTSPYYAVSYNFCESGMFFKSLFEVYPGAHIFVYINDFGTRKNKRPARIVWCKKLNNTEIFYYGVGVEFIKTAKDTDSRKDQTLDYPAIKAA